VIIIHCKTLRELKEWKRDIKDKIEEFDFDNYNTRVKLQSQLLSIKNAISKIEIKKESKKAKIQTLQRLILGLIILGYLWYALE
jgi:hypothetical protein